MTRPKTPLERLLAKHWGSDPQKLASLIEQRFGVRVEPEQLREATDAEALASALKHQVDHPGRLERVAERLLQS
jgi:hypothetical protein